MTDNKLIKLSAIALTFAAAFAAQSAFAERTNCSNWSFNDPDCAAYITPTGAQTEDMAKPVTYGLNCANWSFNDPSCPAFLAATAAGGMQPAGDMNGPVNGPYCTSLSFNDKNCSAYVH